jgi:hydrogenase maturation factor
LLGAVGQDDQARFVLESLHRAGVDTAAIDRIPGATATTVALVNADGTKICVTPQSGDQWCGRLATSGAAALAVGQEVTVIVNTMDADPNGTLSIGTVVPAGVTLK